MKNNAPCNVKQPIPSFDDVFGRFKKYYSDYYHDDVEAEEYEHGDEAESFALKNYKETYDKLVCALERVEKGGTLRRSIGVGDSREYVEWLRGEKERGAVLNIEGSHWTDFSSKNITIAGQRVIFDASIPVGCIDVSSSFKHRIIYPDESEITTIGDCDMTINSVTTRDGTERVDMKAKTGDND